MAKHLDRTLSFSLVWIAAWAVGAGSLAAQNPGVPQMTIPSPVQSVRAPHPIPGMIPTRQDGFPAEVAPMTQGSSNWLEMVQIYSRTHAEITSMRVGWAYALPSGLEFHQSDPIKPPFGLEPSGAYPVKNLDAPARADARDLVVFMEQVTFADKSAHNYDHAKVEAFYKNCCTGANAGRVPPIPQGRQQPEMPGGALDRGMVLTHGLKPITFDVVSFRRADKPGRGREFPDDGDFIAYHGSPIEGLIMFAHIAPKGYASIDNASEPDWVRTELYEFIAKVAPEDLPTWKQMTLTDKRAMVGRMLETTLKLKVHQQPDPQPVYELVVAKGGSKLMDYHAGDTLPVAGQAPVAGHVMGWWGSPFYMNAQDATMADLVNMLSGPDRSGRVVLDKTGLDGTYNFVLPLTPRPLPAQIQQIADDAGVPSLQTGLKQLGLALVPAKGPVDQIVIDHIERPDTN
ncbi:MAG TPA: TIGR03435 family protein [Acidobacteriaceae bacterium]|jgi:uncharacterized protein (TIGR03435 family)